MVRVELQLDKSSLVAGRTEFGGGGEVALRGIIGGGLWGLVTGAYEPAVA